MLISDRLNAFLSGDRLFFSSSCTIYVSVYYYIYDCRKINYIVINVNYIRTLDTSDLIDAVMENIFGKLSFVELLLSVR